MVAYALTVLIGITLGALGSGGAILMLPMLVYVAGYAPDHAIAMTLAVTGAASLIGALVYRSSGSFNSRLALIFGGGGAIGAFAGSFVTNLVPPNVLMLIFGGLLLAIGIHMLRDKQALVCFNPYSLSRCFLIAAGIGVLTGFLGVGGGFLLVPALMRFAGLTPRSAVGTSLAPIALNSAAGLAGHLRHVSLDWTAAIWFTSFAVVGMFSGFILSHRVSGDALKYAFAWLLVFLGVGVTLTNIAKVS